MTWLIIYCPHFKIVCVASTIGVNKPCNARSSTREFYVEQMTWDQCNAWMESLSFNKRYGDNKTWTSQILVNSYSHTSFGFPLFILIFLFLQNILGHCGNKWYDNSFQSIASDVVKAEQVYGNVLMKWAQLKTSAWGAYFTNIFDLGKDFHSFAGHSLTWWACRTAMASSTWTETKENM